MSKKFLDRNLALEAVRVTEAAALSSSIHMGRGNEKSADQAAVNAMRSFLNNLSINGKIVSKCKGGVIVEHLETGSLMFCPGSQISDKPLKNIDHLINVDQKFAIIKLDKIRGNACVSRRQIVSTNKKEDKAKIIGKFKVGDIIKNAVVKGYSSFGCFFVTAIIFSTGIVSIVFVLKYIFVLFFGLILVKLFIFYNFSNRSNCCFFF